MKLTKELETEIKLVMDDYWDSYLKGDLQRWSEYLPDNYRNIGTTQEEIWNSKQEIHDYTNKVINQMVGMADLRNKEVQVIPFDPHIMVHELGDMYIKMDEGWKFYARLRLSSLLEKNDSGWKVLHQHGSYPDAKAEDGETFGFEKISRENRELRDAIKRNTVELEHKNRELEIEAALERIRAHVTAMQESSDLFDIVVSMRNEFKKPGHEADYFWHMRWLPDTYEMSMTSEDGSRIGMVITIPKFVHEEIPGLTEWENGNEPTYVLALNADDAWDYIESMNTHGHYEQADPNAPTLEDIRAIGGLTFIMARTTHGEIGYSLPGVVPDPPEDAVETLVRFAGVFDLAYRRFEDLKKTEALAREAQIELALERIRAGTMAMQHSDELAEASSLLFQQMEALGVSTYSSGFTIWDEEQGELVSWMCNADGSMNPPFRMPIDEEKWQKEQFESWKKGEDFIIKDFTGEEMTAYFRYLRSFPLLDEAFKTSESAGHPMPERQVHHVANFSHGNLLFITLEPVPEAHEIFKRFAKVFEQTYTRFLDLQKAEEQAREAQINLAVERVRAKALAMFKSEEILQVVNTLKNEIMGLDIPNVSAATIHLREPDGRYRAWDLTSIDEEENELDISLDICYRMEDTHPDFFMRRIWENEEDYFVVVQKNSDFKHTIQWLRDNGHSEEADEAEEFFKVSNLQKAYHPTVPLNNGRMSVDLLDEPTPEIEPILKKMASAFDLAYKRFEDLQKAEEQAKEANIQLALERVRAKTNAMKTQSDLLDIIELFGEQLNAVGLRFGLVTFIEGPITKDRDWDLWSYTPQAGTPTQKMFIPYIEHPYFTKTAKNVEEYRKTGRPIQVKTFTKKEKDTFLPHYFKHAPTLPDEVKEFLYGNVGEVIVDAFLGEITVSYAKWGSEPPTEEELEIFERFAKEFRQTYIRFLDIKKAEEQAREAKIEAALEKVRSRSLAMHKSDELNDVVKVLFEKMTELEVPSTSVGIQTFTEDSKDVQCFVCGDVGTGLVVNQYLLPYFDHPILHDYLEAHEKNLDFYVGTYSKKEKDSFYDVVLKLPELKDLPAEVNSMIRESEAYEITMVPAEKSLLAVNDFLGNPLSKSQANILKRFAKVFDQAYTRFLDLQKAEAQARESQIEAALERVRSRSMGMHSSEELLEVIKVIADQLAHLNIKYNNVSFGSNIQYDDIKFWTAAIGLPSPLHMQIPYLDNPAPNRVREAQKDGIKFFADILTPEENRQWIQHVIDYSDIKLLPEDMKNYMLNSVGFARSTFILNNINFYVGNYHAKPYSDTENTIIGRFAQVFEQTYTRFLDLQKAEAQARKAQIEAALERVRSRTMAMQKSDELADTSIVIFEELINLGIEPNRLFIGIIKDEMGTIEAWATNEDGTKIAEQFTLRTERNDSVKKMYDGWKQQKKSLTIDMQGKELEKYFHYLADEMHIPFKGGLSQKRRVQTIAYFGQGLIGMASPDEQLEATTQLLERFAAVFNLTYTRFNDLKIAEAHAIQARKDLIKLKKAKKRAEDAFNKLEATQDQLVQQEKLASLGQLTAGIAHEIKNPLNFVNNFSEVSMELIEEARDEIVSVRAYRDTPLPNDALNEMSDLLNDIEANLRKIHEHGSRADSIVKSMLQHSRGGDGKMEPKDLNALIGEYVNLAFHGMRAAKNPMNVDIELDLDEDIGEVPLIAEDFSRVIVNLCNNAFDAMREKEANVKGETSEGYTPKLTVKTYQANNQIIVEIADNGPGISEEIRDKIMQPFFTTKKGTAGTGLGLSITHDIIKAHGGSLEVTTVQNEDLSSEASAQEGTRFTIKLSRGG